MYKSATKLQKKMMCELTKTESRFLKWLRNLTANMVTKSLVNNLLTSAASNPSILASQIETRIWGGSRKPSHKTASNEVIRLISKPEQQSGESKNNCELRNTNNTYLKKCTNLQLGKATKTHIELISNTMWEKNNETDNHVSAAPICEKNNHPETTTKFIAEDDWKHNPNRVKGLVWRKDLTYHQESYLHDES